ncbi:MAG: hypothetical protein MI923_01600 [Phycisphaerales bacterium]|nr:hypothetical protein [Phycisphaerales bacterium]
MRKETVLASVRTTIRFSEEMSEWIRSNERQFWFAREGGTVFFGEYSEIWNSLLIHTCEPVIQDYFRELGIEDEYMPQLRMQESYRGSWIIDCAIVMFASAGTAYAILKGVSELPAIADGLAELKRRLKPKVSEAVGDRSREQIVAETQEHDAQELPRHIVTTDFVIDARPMLSLTPAQLKSHKIHLSAGISRDSFTLENLGNEPLRQVKIGLFQSSSQRHVWKYEDSHTAMVNLLSAGQTITKDLADFKKSAQSEFSLPASSAVHVDCWVQDNHGIYLFNFFLE